jgi:predicted nuclease with TOPRIM domain
MATVQAEEKAKESEVIKCQRKYNQVQQAIKKLEQQNTTTNEKQKHLQV